MKCEWMVTRWDGKEATMERQTLVSAPDQGQENRAVNLHPDFTYQTFEGMGGALTEAAAVTYYKMPLPLQKELLEAYYGKDGLGYNLARMTVDSCDFSTGNYSAMEVDGDVFGEGFSLERDEQAILPLYREITKVMGKPLQVMLTPWSPPAFMKTNGEKNHGGKLKPEFRRKWADYLCRYVQEYRARGVDVRRLSVQNEPAAVQTWDSCVFTAEEEKEFLRDYLYPALVEHGLEDVEVYIWDHNKERALERTQVAMDGQTEGMIAGVALHWYSGDHFDALRMIRERYPKLKLLFSEACVEYLGQGDKSPLANARRYAHDMMGNLNAGVQLFHDWNILLNTMGGPNHVGNYCDAPMMYDIDGGKLETRLSYHYLGHFSRGIPPGSVRIGCSKYTDTLDVTAFKRPDGQIAVLLLNRTADPLEVWLRLQGQLLYLQLPGDSMGTAMIAMEN